MMPSAMAMYKNRPSLISERSRAFGELSERVEKLTQNTRACRNVVGGTIR